MANNEFTIPIPARLKNVAKGGHVAGAKDIIDDALGKEQSVINQEVSEAIEGNTEAVAAERQRAVAAEGALDTRLSDVEELAEISIDGGQAKIATGEDFHNPTTEQRAKVTTVGAILDGADDEPTAGSDNLVKSGGVMSSFFKMNDNLGYFKDMPDYPVHISGAGKYVVGNPYVSRLVPISNGDKIDITAGSATVYYAQLKAINHIGENNANAEFCDGESRHTLTSQTISVDGKADAAYLFLSVYNGADCAPVGLSINNMNLFNSTRKSLEAVCTELTELSNELPADIAFVYLTEREDKLNCVNRFDKGNIVKGEYLSRSGSTPTGIVKADGYARTPLTRLIDGNPFVVSFDSNNISGCLTFFTKEGGVITSAFYQTMQGAGTVVTPPANAYYYAFTVKTPSVNIIDSLKIEKGSTPTGYTAYGQGFPKEGSEIGNDDIVRVERVGNDLYISYRFNDNYRQVHKCSLNKSSHGNHNFNFEKCWLSAKNSDVKVEGEVFKVCTDDISPIGFQGRNPYGESYAGGNHGFDPYIIGTLNSHGLTSADLGMVFMDTENTKFYLVNIINENKLGLLSENLNAENNMFGFKKPVGSLTNGNITITSVNIDQLNPSTKSLKKELFVDGVKVSDDGVYYGNKILIVDKYAVIDPIDCTERVVANKVDWETASVNSNVLFTFTNNFVVTKDGFVCTILLDFLYAPGTVRYGGISFDAMQNLGSGLKSYMPNVVDFVDSSTGAFTLAEGQDWNSNFAGWTYIGQQRYAGDKTPNRFFQIIMKNNVSYIVGQSGNIPVGDTEDEAVNQNTEYSMAINTYRKIYNRIFHKSNVSNPFTLNSSWYRTFCDPQEIAPKIAFARYEMGGKLYVSANYDSFVGDDTLVCLEEYIGKSITVIDKTENITVKNKFCMKDGIVIIKTDSSIGHIVLKIE